MWIPLALAGLPAWLLLAQPGGPGAVPPSGTVATEAERLESAAWARFLEQERRLLQVGERIRIHGLDLCGDKRSPVLGILAATEEEVPEFLRGAARRDAHVDAGVRILHVEPGLPAEAAGLRAGDRVLEVDGRRATRGDRLTARHALDQRGPLRLRVEREGSPPLDLAVSFLEGCFSPAAVWLADFENAYLSNDNHLVVTSGMLRFLESDDELAVLLGHETAHYVLGHVWSRPPYERDADYLGLYLAARAGYDVSVAPGLWERMARVQPFSLDQRAWRSHPGSPERALSLRAAVDEIRAKGERGAPLVPEPAQ